MVEDQITKVYDKKVEKVIPKVKPAEDEEEKDHELITKEEIDEIEEFEFEEEVWFGFLQSGISFFIILFFFKSN